MLFGGPLPLTERTVGQRTVRTEDQLAPYLKNLLVVSLKNLLVPCLKNLLVPFLRNQAPVIPLLYKLMFFQDRQYGEITESKALGNRMHDSREVSGIRAHGQTRTDDRRRDLRQRGEGCTSV